VLAELAGSEHVTVRADIAGNPAARELLARLAADPDPAVRAAVVENTSTPLDVLKQLGADSECCIRERALARHESLQETLAAIDQSMDFVMGIETLASELDASPAEEKQGEQVQSGVADPAAASQAVPRATLETKIEELAALAGVSDAALVSFLRAQSADARVRAHLEQLQARPSAEQGRQQRLATPALPPGLSWPTETYSSSPEAKRGGGGIIAFLQRVWSPLLQAGSGFVDLRTMREIDPSAAMGVTKLKQRGGSLPNHLEVPTRREINDRMLAQIAHNDLVPMKDADRLARARRRRQK